MILFFAFLLFVEILTELCQGLDHGGLVLPDRLHRGHVVRGEVEPVTLERRSKL